VTASEKKDRNIKALRRLHLLPFTRKQKIIYDWQVFWLTPLLKPSRLATVA